jgi:predicted helicase
MPQDALSLANAYLKNLQKHYSPNAREHTYRSAMEAFIEDFAKLLGKKVVAKNDPAQAAKGIKPDFIVEEHDLPIGWVETKDIGEKLDKTKTTDQLIQYKKQLPNLILTDYLEFRWFVAGELKLSFKLINLHGDKLTLDEKNVDVLQTLFEQFFNQALPALTKPKDLAERMASLAKIIKHAAILTLESGNETPLRGMLDSFQRTLIPTLKPDEFADMYAQTITYGLFAAWFNTPAGKTFDKRLAWENIPATSPFLKKFFTQLSIEKLDSLDWVTDILVRLLASANMSDILKDFGKGTMQHDPVVHFYETFLAAYDKETKKDRGVFYTPEPVVSFIVRSVDSILQTHFEMPDGLADKNAIILDPATGTATFLYSVITKIHESKNGTFWNEYVSKNMLPRIFGFELMMAPYAVAHLKLGLHLRELGYTGDGSLPRIKDNVPLGIFLTNALDPAKFQVQGGFDKFVADETNAASEVKTEKKVMVVLGNPPYKGSSLNPSEVMVVQAGETKTKKIKTHIGTLIETYKKVDGVKLSERQTKWLQDDYVKFIRSGQDRIDRTGYGVLAFITNNGFIDNPTFRGMRQSLMNSFDEIYILDLHGSIKKKETDEHGGKDENVFPIQQGVSINFFIKRNQPHTKPARVFHSEVFGVRKKKYEFLASNDIASLLKRKSWHGLTPQKPFYLFVPQEASLLAAYQQGWSVKDIFPINSVGIVTSRDHFAIAFDDATMKRRIERFRDPSRTDEQIAQEFNLKDTNTWQLSEARKIVFRNCSKIIIGLKASEQKQVESWFHSSAGEIQSLY